MERDDSGEPIKRELPKTLPCRKDPISGCPKGTAEKSIELNEQGKQIWRHYQECKAIGKFPDDPIVRRNARVISEIEHAADRALLGRSISNGILKGLSL